MPLSRRTKTSVTVHQAPIPVSSSQSMSYSEDDYLDDSYDYTEPDEDWEDEDDLQPSDSASASNGHAPIAHRGARRAHRVVPQYRHHQQSPQGHQPQAPPSMDPNEEWGGHYGRAQSVYYPQGQTAHAPYIAGQAARGHHGYHQQQGNQHVGPYMGGYPNGNQMVPFANYGPNNPFSQHMGNSSNGNNYFSNEGRPMYDMMQYQHNGYYGNPQHFGVPAHMQQFQMVPAPPVPAPTEHPGQSVTPAPKEPPAPPPDLDKIRLEAEVAALKKHQDEVKAAEKQREVEAQIRKDAEINFQRRMEDMRKAQEEAQKEIEKAKLEAERTARERIEAERKAEEERQKAHSAAMQRAEESARMKFEAELKAAEERRKRGEEDRQRAEEKARLRFEAEMRAAEERRRKEDEDRQRAEESARIRLEAAIKAEAAAKAAAEQKAAEEVARLKQIEEDAKKKAEADAAAKAEKEKADALAQAEAEAAAKKAADELKKKIQEEAKADALAQAEAAAAAKKEAEELKKIIQEEAKVKFEEAAKKKADKAPIKFKDAVGRKFSFPFHLCATWQGMEELIKQAFLQVDVLGPHVQEGHYDLIGPNGEIILPSVWEKVVEPDWNITMTMWPIEKSPPLARAGGPHMGGKHGIPIPPPPHVRSGMAPPGRRPGGIPSRMPPMPPSWPEGPARPARPGPGIDIVTASAPKTHKKEKRPSASVLTFLAGKPSKKKSSKK